METAVLTMVHTEHRLLKQWLHHYERIVGRSNMYVIAHGGDNEVMRLATGCQMIHAPRRRVDWRFDRLRFELINAYANYLLENYQCVIAGDVDELVFCDPQVSPNLLDYLAQFSDKPVVTPFGFHIVQQRDELSLNDEVSFLKQRRFAVPDSDYCKPIVAFQRPSWSRGYHASKHAPFLPDHLYMTHLRCVDAGIANDTAAKRQETANTAPNLGNKASQRFWKAHDVVFRRLRRRVNKAEAVELDDAIEAFKDDLRGNIAVNHAGRGGQSMTFSAGVTRVVHLPERFADFATQSEVKSDKSDGGHSP
jgi:hypothetical protein